MPYAQTDPEFGPITLIGDRKYRRTISFTETDVGVADEWVVKDLPRHFDLVSYKATKTAGTAATIGPVELGDALLFVVNTQAHLATSTKAPHATHINDQTVLAVILPVLATLVGRTTPDAGTDNDVSTELVIEFGE